MKDTQYMNISSSWVKQQDMKLKFRANIQTQHWDLKYHRTMQAEHSMQTNLKKRQKKKMKSEVLFPLKNIMKQNV